MPGAEEGRDWKRPRPRPTVPQQGKQAPWGCATKLRSRAESSVWGERTRAQPQVPRGSPGEGGCSQRRAGRARAAFPVPTRRWGPRLSTVLSTPPGETCGMNQHALLYNSSLPDAGGFERVNSQRHAREGCCGLPDTQLQGVLSLPRTYPPHPEPAAHPLSWGIALKGPTIVGGRGGSSPERERLQQNWARQTGDRGPRGKTLRGSWGGAPSLQPDPGPPARRT